jgi:hypothetical protein
VAYLREAIAEIVIQPGQPDNISLFPLDINEKTPGEHESMPSSVERYEKQAARSAEA